VLYQLTNRCSRRPPASAALPLPGAAELRALATLSATMRYDEAELAFDTLSSEMF